jgi:UDP-glucose:(heptosyl)LPS alpha-1,3-glucosyltransferase
MKIALVRARYNPFGGAERFAARALAALAGDAQSANAEVTVIARRWQDIETADRQKDASTTVRVLRCDPFYIGSVWRDASFASAVRRCVRDERFDLVQSHERIAGLPLYRAGDGVHASWLERRMRAGTAATRLDIALNPHHHYLLRAERAMFEHPALRAVICNSEMVRREIAERFAIDRDKLVLIRNGVDLERFHPDAQAMHRDAMRMQLEIVDDAFVFVMVGSGFERKGVSLALRALCA